MSSPAPAAPPDVDPGQLVLYSIYVYVPIFLVLVIIYSLLRSKYPNLYDPKEQRGYAGILSWIPMAYKWSEKDILDKAGLDGLCFIRWVEFGAKCSIIGLINAVVLIPVYYTEDDSPSNLNARDKLSRISLGHLSTNSPRMAASVVCTYIFFLSVIYLIYKEFSWFLSKRHDFLSRSTPDNYTVYLENIPARLRSRTALGDFLSPLARDKIVDIKISMKIDELEKEYGEREKLFPKLEHAKNVLDSTGKRPTHKSGKFGLVGPVVDSIEFYTNELQKANNDISMAVTALENVHMQNEKIPGASQEIRSGAFVTFSTLLCSTTALQILHNGTPYTMTARTAPLPKDVFWTNVGLSHPRVQAGNTLSTILTIMLCIFWTVPVGFISGLSSLDGIKSGWPALGDAVDANPWLGGVIAQLAPLLLIVFVALLPPILMQFAKLEGHISLASLQAALFGKLAIFQLIQVFFVTALAGSLLSNIDGFTKDPGNAILSALGNNLPGQASTFMIFVLVKVCLSASFEVTRIVPAIIAMIRSKLGPKITEKERRQPWLGLKPLCFKFELTQPALLAHQILVFMVLFVYSILHPISCIVTLASFAITSMVYRNNLVHIYHPTNDTGGQFWPIVAKYLIYMMVISQLTIIAVLGIKEGPSQAALTFPLVLITLYFGSYIGQQHYRVSRILPSADAADTDKAREESGFPFNTFQNLYLQRALGKKIGHVHDSDLPPPAWTQYTDGSSSSSGMILLNQDGQGQAKAPMGDNAAQRWPARDMTPPPQIHGQQLEPILNGPVREMRIQVGHQQQVPQKQYVVAMPPPQQQNHASHAILSYSQSPQPVNRGMIAQQIQAPAQVVGVTQVVPQQGPTAGVRYTNVAPGGREPATIYTSPPATQFQDSRTVMQTQYR